MLLLRPELYVSTGRVRFVVLNGEVMGSVPAVTMRPARGIIMSAVALCICTGGVASVCFPKTYNFSSQFSILKSNLNHRMSERSSRLGYCRVYHVEID
jgi:hypothetical protein